MTLGFIGTGSIAAAVIKGLCRADPAPDAILVSPRNAEKAAALADEFPCVTVAADNQAVIDGSDWVFLALLPHHAHGILADLDFRAEQKVVSLMAAVRMPDLAELCAPATDICRAVPLPPVAQHVGPTAVYPGDAKVLALFDRIGRAVPVATEREFHMASTVTAFAATYFAFLGHLAERMIRDGTDPAAARRYVAAFGQAVSLEAGAAEDIGFDTLIDNVSTPKGMNEQVLRMLTEAGWFAPMDPAFDAILARHEGTA